MPSRIIEAGIIFTPSEPVKYQIPAQEIITLTNEAVKDEKIFSTLIIKNNTITSAKNTQPIFMRISSHSFCDNITLINRPSTKELYKRASIYFTSLTITFTLVPSGGKTFEFPLKLTSLLFIAPVGQAAFVLIPAAHESRHIKQPG